MQEQVLTQVSSIVRRLFSKSLKDMPLVFLCLQYWLFINSHREHRAHGFGLSLLQLLSDLAAILTSKLKVSFS